MAPRVEGGRGWMVLKIRNSSSSKEVDRKWVEVTVTVPRLQGVTAGGFEAQAQGAATGVMQETFLLVSWSATFAMIAGLRIFVLDLGNLGLLRTFISRATITRVLKIPMKEPRGFGFVQFVDPADAEDAKYQMDGQILLGRELTVVFAEENRKKPSEMRARERISRRRHDYYSPSPRGRRYSRSISPRDVRYRKRSYSGSPYGSRSPSRSPVRSRSLSRDNSRSPDDYSR
ncbi:Serine/arginine-rich SC35-like splicing factor SCL33 [Abeliophyllum distichum]|uniref:Serine/arginine-rich SC35-like splicing factor SCL33 n=1 Tax=Abeliophyllum distichum TaxID=126358 RepID=A0ABD1VCW3_9LAMI